MPSRPLASRLPLLLPVSFATLLLACGGGGGGASAGASAPAPPVAPGREPVAKLDPAAGLPESFTLEEGGPTAFLYFEAPRVRLSASCKKGDAIECEAYRTLRDAPAVELPKREVGGATSAGTKVCTKVGGKLADGTNAVGVQDAFCRFGDGSLVSTGALEQYLLRVFE